MRRGGGAKFDVAAYGFPRCPEAAGLGAAAGALPPERLARRLSASYFVFVVGSLRTSLAAEMAWNLALYSSSFPGLRSGWYLRAVER